MNNDTISVPCELAEKLEQALKIFTGHDSYPNLRHHYGNEWWEPINQMRDELRALLAQPNTCTKDGSQCEPPVGYVPCSPQLLDSGVDCATAPRWSSSVWDGHSHWHPAAQAPVVLPARADPEYFDSIRATGIGLNACLDELKRLNPGIEP